MKAKPEHLDAEERIRAASGEPIPPGASVHARGCAACRVHIEADRALLASLAAAADLAEPPPGLVDRVVARFPQRPSLAARVVEVAARLVRSLVPATLGAPALAGVRGAGLAGAGRLTFAAPGLTVELAVEGEGDGLRLNGQIFAEAEASLPLLVRVERHGLADSEAPVADHGSFQIVGVPAPPFDVVLELEGGRVRARFDPAGFAEGA